MGIEPSPIDVIGYHGHTVLHRPEQRLTVQLGDGAMLARLTGRAVVNDLRAADVQAGGEGAARPGVSLGPGCAGSRTAGGVRQYRRRRQCHLGRPRRALLAFDCGPGNALMDDWAMRHTGQPVDIDGALARSGTPDEAVLRTFMALSGWRRNRSIKAISPWSRWSTCHRADGAATLARLTAATIARAASWFPEQPTWWIVCGGGRRNRFLMELLAWHLTAPVAPAEALGLDGDAIEARLLSRGEEPEGSADYLPDHDAGAAADDRRGAASKVVRASAVAAHAAIEVGAAHLDQLVRLVLEEVIGPRNDLVIDLDAALGLELDTRLLTASGGVTTSFSPWTNRPEAGAGGKEREIIMPASGATEMKPVTWPPHQQLHGDPGAGIYHADEPADAGLAIERLQPVQRRGSVRQLAGTVLEQTLAPSHLSGN